MIYNYLKLAWRVLGRKKFFTFISLFGISFTLGIFMIIVSFLQNQLGANTPISQKEDLIFLERLELRREFFDTITVVDTIQGNLGMVYDTTYEYRSRGRMNNTSELNNKIIEQYLTNLPSIEDRTLFSVSTSDIYVNSVKLSLLVIHTDHSFWNVFDHQLIEGRYFDQTETERAAQVMVISEKTAVDYFGTSKNIIDRELEMEGKLFKIVGLIKTIKRSTSYLSPDVVIPYTIADASIQSNFYHGFYEVMFKKSSETSLRQAKEVIDDAAKTIPLDHPDNTEGYDQIILGTSSFDEMLAQDLYDDDDEEKSYAVMKWALIILLVLFILLPTLNLINLNVSRIMDRSSEIGVRKAFGAHRQNILMQFILENIVQTILGGIIGLFLAIGGIYLLNNSGALGEVRLTLNASFFLYAIGVTLLFGILSGLIPAFKMSQLHIVKALKSTQL